MHLGSKSKKIAAFWLLFFLTLIAPIYADPIVLLSNSMLPQGSSLRMDIILKKPAKTLNLDFLGRSKNVAKVSSSKKGHHYIAYLGIPRRLKPGHHDFRLSITYQDGEKNAVKKSVDIGKGPFKVSHIQLKGYKKKLAKNTSQLTKEAKLLSKKFQTFTPKPLFKGSFITPTKGELTTLFGASRRYNGKPGSPHSGVDYANKIGTRVNAPNYGRVLYSDTLKSHGKTILIDHGLGIISIYLHLSKLSVKEGDFVKKGQRIGEIGMTGISTGPHLHWGLSIQNTRVNPLDWIDQKHLYVLP